MAIRIARRGAKQLRIPAKRGKKAEMPGADELRNGLAEAQALAVAQKKRGFLKRDKRGRYVKRKRTKKGA